MLKKPWKLITKVCLFGFLLIAMPQEAMAANTETSSSYLVKIEAPAAKLYEGRDEGSGMTGRVLQGETYDVISYGDGWAKIRTDSSQGYLRLNGQATMVETTKEKVDKEARLREEVVNYALQFVGNRYVYGGTDPHTGVDCSGFTAYVMRHMAGISLSHSSAAQAGEGKKVSNPQPGDLIFYSNGSRINHVAIYMGDGQIVHASSAKTGIKVSRWNSRTPVKIVDVLSR